MKNKITILILAICCAATAGAQNSLFDKYSDMDGVTSVYISKAMFEMVPAFLDQEDIDLKNMAGKLDGLQILTTSKKELTKQMRDEFKSLITKDHTELMRVKDSGTNVNFYARQDKDLIKELVMLVNESDSSFVAIQILGKFTLDDVKQITESVNK